MIRSETAFWIGLAIAFLASTGARADQAPTSRPAPEQANPQSDTEQPPNQRANPHAPNLDPSVVPPRPPPLIELGDKFFGAGPLQKGIELPTGAVWMPNFTVFGTFRSAVQAFHDPLRESGPAGSVYSDKTRSEWANRLDLYANLQLSGTERVLAGFRPLDNGVFARPGLAKYTGYQISPDATDGWVYKFNAEPTTLFFEGDIGQIFPSLDPYGTRPLDIGFSVGRQPLLYQDGLLIDDDMDAIGVTQNTILPHGGSNLQITALYGWDRINSGDGIDHGSRALAGLFINADFRPTTWNLDLVFVKGHGGESDGAYGGLSATQRIWELNTTFRVLASRALGHDSGGPGSPLSTWGNGSSAIGSGVLLLDELSYTIAHSNDLVYLDSYWGIDRYTSAAHGPDRGGTLGRVGILFAEQPIGRYGSALSSDAERSAGFALGYQKFFDPDRRRQLILEAGGREAISRDSRSAVATGARYQQAFGQHAILQFDTFISLNEGRGLGYGGRVELRLEF